MAINKIAHFHLDWFAEHSSLLDSGLVNVSCLPGSLSCHLILPCLKTASLHSKISQGKKFFLKHSFITSLPFLLELTLPITFPTEFYPNFIHLFMLESLLLIILLYIQQIYMYTSDRMSSQTCHSGISPHFQVVL